MSTLRLITIVSVMSCVHGLQQNVHAGCISDYQAGKEYCDRVAGYFDSAFSYEYCLDDVKNQYNNCKDFHYWRSGMELQREYINMQVYLDALRNLI